MLAIALFSQTSQAGPYVRFGIGIGIGPGYYYGPGPYYYGYGYGYPAYPYGYVAPVVPRVGVVIGGGGWRRFR